ncbi:MAG: hypothetical protein EBR40_06650 [Proteobacteria bacterium]|nr:hypothetical protein [Pseudomonadota bacterium]
MSKARLLQFLSLLALAFTGNTQETTLLSKSPDGRFLLRRERAESGDRGEARKTLAICSREGKVLYEWFSPLGATTPLWSGDSHFLAVNDMPGEAGDQLRIFCLDPSGKTAVPLRDPDGAQLKSEVEKRHGNFLSTVDKASLRASEWKEGRLWCTVTGTFSPKRQPTVHVPFHHLWVYRIDGTNAPVLEQEWTLTDPKERSYRDSSATP